MLSRNLVLRALGAVTSNISIPVHPDAQIDSAALAQRMRATKPETLAERHDREVAKATPLPPIRLA